MNKRRNFVLQVLGVFLVMISLSSCSFNQKIKSGEMAYERKQYSVAVDLLTKEFEDSRDPVRRARLSFLLGKSSTQLLRYKDAEYWFLRSNEIDDASPSTLIALGNSQKSLEKYTDAVKTFSKLAANVAYKQEAQREILICRQSIEALSQPKEYIVERLKNNSLVSEFSPAIYDRDFLVFTSENSQATGKSTYEWTGERYSDIFVMPKTGDEVRRFDSAINTPKNEGAACFSGDMQTMYFNRCFSFLDGDEHCKLMVSQRTNDVWSVPQVLPFVRDGYQYKHPALIENDSVLVFSSDLVEAGGQMDLFYSVLDIDGSWSEPSAFPNIINTVGNELFPVGDRDTLYFSSDYLPSLGGFDIYKTYLKNNQTWSSPLQMPAPINSGGDDFSFVVDRSEKLLGVVQSGYFSSSRNGVGKDDIFRFSKLAPTIPKEKTTKADTFIQVFYLVVSTKTRDFISPNDPNSGFLKNVVLPSTFLKILAADGSKINEGISGANGVYIYEVPSLQNMRIIGSKPGFLNQEIKFDISQISFAKDEKTVTINLEIVLEKIFENMEVNIPDIYYEYDKWDIKTESLPILDKLCAVIIANPQVDIELFSHTDCRGDDKYNDELSQRRAQSVVSYLTSKGINLSRLKATGMGERALVELCDCLDCTEDQHQTNRRTSFKIKQRK
jgi:peptidoglycan-associated lipoprotein